MSYQNFGFVILKRANYMAEIYPNASLTDQQIWDLANLLDDAIGSTIASGGPGGLNIQGYAGEEIEEPT